MQERGNKMARYSVSQIVELIQENLQKWVEKTWGFNPGMNQTLE